MRAAALTLLLLLAPIAARAQPKPCADAAHHAFDFWIGRWSVTETRTGEPAGQSLIEGLYGGCTIRENWSEPGYTGGSLNSYDAATGKWRQTWTDSAGTWREFVGGMEDGKMVLVARQPSRRDPAKTVRVRLSFTPNPDGSVRQYSDMSADDGATWIERYDYTLSTRRLDPQRHQDVLHVRVLRIEHERRIVGPAKPQLGHLARDLVGDVQQVAGVEAQLEGLAVVVELQLFHRLAGFHVAHGQHAFSAFYSHTHGPGLLRRDGGHAVDGLGEELWGVHPGRCGCCPWGSRAR